MSLSPVYGAAFCSVLVWLLKSSPLCHSINWRYFRESKPKEPQVLVPEDRSPTLKYRKKWENTLIRAQEYIGDALSQLEGGKLGVEVYGDNPAEWGRMKYLENGHLFDKLGVGVFIINEKMSSPVPQIRTKGIEYDTNGNHTFYLAGLSVSVYPRNPMMPEIHQRYRFSQLLEEDTNTSVSWWFGGGSYLSPSYVYKEDAVHFHKAMKHTYDKFDKSFYSRFKNWADEQYVNRHRGEGIGIGGVYFDGLDDRDPHDLQEFVSAAIDTFVDAYIPIVATRRDMHFNDTHKEWQQLRRGSHVEFTLMHDSDVRMSLEMSNTIFGKMFTLPTTAEWHRVSKHKFGDDELNSLEILKRPRNWI